MIGKEGENFLGEDQIKRLGRSFLWLAAIDRRELEEMPKIEGKFSTWYQQPTNQTIEVVKTWSFVEKLIRRIWQKLLLSNFSTNRK